MSNRYSNHDYQGTVEDEGVIEHAFAMKQEVKDDIGEKASNKPLKHWKNRIDETGVKELSIVVKGGQRSMFSLNKDVQQAMSVIGTAAVLEFMLVDEDAYQSP